MIRGKGGLEFSPCVLWSVRLFRSLPARRHGRLAHRPTAAAPLPLGHPAACERCVAPEWLSLAGDRGNRRRWVRLFAQAWRDRKFSFQKHPPVRNHKSPIRERGLPGAPQCYSFSDDRPTASNIRLTTSISWRPVSGSRVALAIFASSFVRQFHDIELCCHSGPPSRTALPRTAGTREQQPRGPAPEASVNDIDQCRRAPRAGSFGRMALIEHRPGDIAPNAGEYPANMRN